MAVVLVFLGSLFVSSVIGHFVHVALHKRWSGVFNRGHMEHHTQLYPPKDLVSDVYRYAKWYNSGPFLFAPVAVVLLVCVWLVTWLAGFPFWVTGVFSVTLLAFSFVNDYVHDSFHLKDHWLARYKTWRAMRYLHFVHHKNMRKNFGITFYGWDKVFKTFRLHNE